MGTPFNSRSISRHAPTLQAAHDCLGRVRPGAYAKTRNFLDGAVTRLSPYITHGLLNIPQCIERLGEKHTLSLEDKLIYEFAWREYFQHVWTRLGSGILSDIRNPIWRGKYNTEVPWDILEGATGIPAIDASVRTLYETGYLHNHARMWLASYVVHMRKVDWKAGAAWMYAYLLDGDLASNFLSWQWVAGTFAHKPYLFNADNVARYAAQWDCKGSVIDQSYADLEAFARGKNDCGKEKGRHEAICPPPLVELPEVDFWRATGGVKTLEQIRENPPKGSVYLVHPWDLGASSEGHTGLKVGLIDISFHAQFKWSKMRWEFVAQRMGELVDEIWIVDTKQLLATVNCEWRMTETLNPGYEAVGASASALVTPAPRFFSNPTALQPSFTRFFDMAVAGRELQSPRMDDLFRATA